VIRISRLCSMKLVVQYAVVGYETNQKKKKSTAVDMRR